MAKYEVQTEQGKYLIETESPQEEITTPQTFKQNQLDKTISQRPDIYKQAVQGIQNLPQNMIQSAGMPGLPLLNIGLKSLGGVAQRAEAAVANPFLEMGANKGTIGSLPYRMGKSIKQGITGEKLGELGDVARQAGLPEPVSAGLGLLGTGIVGGVLARGAGLTQKATDLGKLETSYGKDISKNIIKHTTGLTDEAIEHGQTKGWDKILTKENLDPNIGYNLVLKTKKGLQNFYRNLNKTYGEKLDEIASNVDLEVPIDNIKNTLKNRLINNGILDFEGKALRNPSDKVEREIVRIYEDLGNTHGQVGIKDIVKLKNKLWNTIRSSALQGNQPINSSERLIYDLQSEIGNSLQMAGEYLPSDKSILSLQQLNSWYAPKRQLFNTANRMFKVFKNDYETKTAENTLKNYFNLDIGSKQLLQQLDETLPTKFLEPLKDWLTTQNLLIQPSGGFFRETIATPVKYGVRQGLRSGIPSFMGRNTGKEINKFNLIPASILKMMQKKNQLDYQVK